jgi:hypothetical protein
VLHRLVLDMLGQGTWQIQLAVYVVSGGLKVEYQSRHTCMNSSANDSQVTETCIGAAISNDAVY